MTALLQGLCLFALTPAGITNRQLRPLVAQLLGVPDDQYTARQMGYDLRRLARQGLLERQPGRLSYTLTPWGRRVALLLTKLHVRVLRPGLQAIDPRIPSNAPPAIRIALQEVDIAVRSLARQAAIT